MSRTTQLSVDEHTHRNGELILAYTNGVIDGSITNDAPRGALLVLLPRDDDELLEANIQMGIEMIRQGEDVYFRYLKPRS